MSVEVTNRVWTNSTRKGSDLVLMLALANRADEDGICWPGLQYLAARARVVERQARRMLRQLEAAREIFTLTGRGRGRTTYYFVTVGLTLEQIERVLITRLRMKPLEAAAALQQWLDRRGVESDDESDSGSDGDAEAQIKGDAGVPFYKGDIPPRKGDIRKIKPDIPGRKGDIAMSPKTKEETKEGKRKTHTHAHGGAPSLPLGQPVSHGEGVCVNSRYSFEQRLAYARNQPHVDNPEGFAMSRRAVSGEFDEAITAWLATLEHPAGVKPRDVSACPDCHGSGWWYPEGPTKGAARCKHLRLDEGAGSGPEAVPP
ncbi:MAG TPA: helix-turn-helix domain-containing protein [Pyrinomonadaceae bacterium]|nr:helix-turn-helix domain-containing protein [Pyrinomonadaceae bacterium]